MTRGVILKRVLFFGLLSAALLAAAGVLLIGLYRPEALSWVLVYTAKGFLLALLLALLLWLGWLGLRRFLWRVGRRLAFSYFLIGVLPIPMLFLLGLLNVYLLSGYFLGHLYRDAVHELHHDLTYAAESGLARWSASGEIGDDADGTLAFYWDGIRLAGAEAAPWHWPDWLAAGADEPAPGERRLWEFAALSEDAPVMAAGASSGRLGVLALTGGDLEQELTRRSGVWVELLRADDPRRESFLRLSFAGQEFTLQPLGAKRTLEARSQFFGVTTEDPGWLDRPWLWWGEIGGVLRSLDSGEVLSDYMAASLNGNLRTVYRYLASSSGEVDTAVWVGLIAVTGLLSTVYGLAVLMALWIIVGLSRAVNRLSRATTAVRGGDFSVRIASRRRDQIGELEATFNEMTGNLERLVDSAARQESLHKELAIARDLQQSLLPADLPTSEAVEFATLFEPSAAIGGDYFDVLRIDDDRLAVVVADVSGHGLPTGLRMAMLKAALVILVEEQKPAEEILRRLNGMVRAEHRQRFFVTATIAVVDFRRHRVQITNAAHPPVYLIRDQRAEEILLTGSPLGALGEEYDRREVDLEPGDVLVWLSDGLIEAANETDEPFGYERTQAVLAGPTPSATAVRNRLLAAVREHTGGLPPEDDRTLVVMRYRPRDGAPVDGAPVDTVPSESRPR